MTYKIWIVTRKMKVIVKVKVMKVKVMKVIRGFSAGLKLVGLRLLGLRLLGLGLVGLVGLGLGSVGATQSVKQPVTQHVRVILDWQINPDHAPLLVALEKGYFRQEGLQVELISPSNASDGSRLVAAGKAEFALTYEPTYMVMVDKQIPVIRVGTLVKSPLSAIVVLKSAHISSMKGLKGKRIGYAAVGDHHAILAAMLAHNGLTLKDVRFVSVGFNLVQALAAGQIDAIEGGMRTVTVEELSSLHKPAKAFLPEKNGVPSYEELIIVAAYPVNTKMRSITAHFLRALQKGQRYLQSHPHVTWQLFATHYPALNTPINKKLWMITQPYFSPTPSIFKAKEYKHFAYFMKKSKLITHVASSARYGVDVSTGGILSH